MMSQIPDTEADVDSDARDIPRCRCCRRPLRRLVAVRLGYGWRCAARLHIGAYVEGVAA